MEPFSDHPTIIALMLGVEGIERDTKVILEVDENGYLVGLPADEPLDHPLTGGMFDRAKAFGEAGRAASQKPA